MSFPVGLCGQNPCFVIIRIDVFPLDKIHGQNYCWNLQNRIDPQKRSLTPQVSGGSLNQVINLKEIAMQHRFLHGLRQVPPANSSNQPHFKDFDATELYCPQCNRAVPVRKRLLIVLPEGDKYEYLCALCSTSVGTKVVRGADSQSQIII